MREEYRKNLDKHLDDLCNNLDPTGGLLQKLLTQGIINAQQKAVIQAKTTDFDKNDVLITILKTRNDDDYDKFWNILYPENKDLVLRCVPGFGVPPIPIPTPTPTPTPGQNRDDSDLQDFQHDGLQLPDLQVNVEPIGLQSIAELMSKTAYPIDILKPNGRAYIINVNKVEGKGERKGTNKDRDYLQALFKGLGFTVTVYNDGDGLSAEEIEKKVRNMADIENKEKDAQCFVLCILSHGLTLKGSDPEGLNDEGAVCGTDRNLVKNNTLFDILNDTNCPGLKGKPRLIFFQACRSWKAETDDVTSNHFLVGYPAQKGQYAYRYGGGEGSTYIRSLVQEFTKNACKCDLVEMLDNVTNQLKDKTYDNNGSKMVPETDSNLKGKFYFFPRKL